MFPITFFDYLTTLRFSDAILSRRKQTRLWRSSPCSSVAIASLSRRSFPLGVVASHAMSSHFYDELPPLNIKKSLLSYAVLIYFDPAVQRMPQL